MNTETELQKAVIVSAKGWTHEWKKGTKVKVKPANTEGVYYAIDESGKVDWVLPTEIKPE